MQLHIVLVCWCVIVATTASTSHFEIRKHGLFNKWLAYKEEFQKSYSSVEEEIKRFKTWQENSRIIKEHNLRGESYRLAINQFGDISNDEFRAKMLDAGGRYWTRFDRHGTNFLPAMNVQPPVSIDWRKEGFVTAVKRQWQCIGSWAFSATGSLEGQHTRQTGELVSLSEQQLIDCSVSFGNRGCASGSPVDAFEFVIANGLVTEEDYPYKAKTNNCTEHHKDSALRIRGYSSIKKGSEDDLLNAVITVGPISVKVDASSTAFQFYSEGVLNETRCSQEYLDHDMLVVGYGELKGQPYWLVKNSWAVTWGSQGYILMSRNASNQCGIASRAVFPLV